MTDIDPPPRVWICTDHVSRRALSRLRTAILTANALAHADGSIPEEEWKRVLECVEGETK